jgi:hypothetical protein
MQIGVQPPYTPSLKDAFARQVPLPSPYPGGANSSKRFLLIAFSHASSPLMRPA